MLEVILLAFKRINKYIERPTDTVSIKNYKKNVLLQMKHSSYN